MSFDCLQQRTVFYWIENLTRVPMLWKIILMDLKFNCGDVYEEFDNADQK
jgi:hypothetical protein